MSLLIFDCAKRGNLKLLINLLRFFCFSLWFFAVSDMTGTVQFCGQNMAAFCSQVPAHAHRLTSTNLDYGSSEPTIVGVDWRQSAQGSADFIQVDAWTAQRGATRAQIVRQKTATQFFTKPKADWSVLETCSGIPKIQGFTSLACARVKCACIGGIRAQGITLGQGSTSADCCQTLSPQS